MSGEIISCYTPNCTGRTRRCIECARSDSDRHLACSRCAKCVEQAHELARTAQDRNLTAALTSILAIDREST